MTASDYRLGELSRQAYDILSAFGLDLPEKPVSSMPKLPDSLTDMSDEALMDSYAEFVAWSDYATSQVSAAAVDERHAQARLDEKESEVMLRDWVAKETVAKQKARSATDPEIKTARQALDQAYAYRKLVESIATAMERNAQMLSRELTRRTSNDNKTTRRGRHL